MFLTQTDVFSPGEKGFVKIAEQKLDGKFSEAFTMQENGENSTAGQQESAM